MSTAKSSLAAQPAALQVMGDRAQFLKEFQHLRSNWFWFFLLGIILVACGTTAIIFPAVTVSTSFLATMALGIALMVAGVATIITSFWAGRWGGLLLQLLVGILYVVVGYEISDEPLKGAVMLTAFIAAMFVVLGFFRIVAALVIRFPYWGWALLNGVITLLCGVVIYRHFPQASLWVIGLLVGIEMLFHGWNWIMLSIAVRNIPESGS